MKSYKDTLYSLVGKELKLPVSQNEYNKGRVTSAQWLVIAAYPHHILCERRCENDYIVRESFDVGTLVHEGILDRTVDHEYRKHFSNGWGC